VFLNDNKGRVSNLREMGDASRAGETREKKGKEVSRIFAWAKGGGCLRFWTKKQGEEKSSFLVVCPE